MFCKTGDQLLLLMQLLVFDGILFTCSKMVFVEHKLNSDSG